MYRFAELNGERIVVLHEDWAAWDAQRHTRFQGVKSGPFFSFDHDPLHPHDSPGRGPTGKLRNFKAMSDDKLHHTLSALHVHGEDDQAEKAARAEWERRYGGGEAQQLGLA